MMQSRLLWTCRHCGKTYTGGFVGNWADEHLKARHPAIWRKFKTAGTYGDHYSYKEADTQ